MPEERLKESQEDKLEKPEKKKTRSFINKVVIRKLPPSLTKTNFIEIISPMPDNAEILYFCPADWTLGGESTSRAYIEFKKEEDIFIFKDKFDGYIFVDSVRGSDYPAVVEYAAFQGLPKSRARKKDKNVGSIEECDHFVSFLEQLKKEEDEEGTTTKNEVTYSYQMKDDKKITSTPLIEFLAAKNQEKRDAKRKKVEDKRKQRDEEKQKKKIQVAKNIPEPIKESKEEVVYADGITVRTVPSRLGRNDRKKEKEKEAKAEKEPKADKEPTERREKREKEKSEREIRRKKERDEKRKLEREQRDLQKAKDREQQKEVKAASADADKGNEPVKESTAAPVKSETTKRYSALRKARQEKSGEVKEATEPKEDEKEAPKVEEKPKREEDPAKKEARQKRAQEQRERRADERPQRHIKNKDRPTLQIYRPTRRQDTDGKSENLKSSDEYSETSRKRSDNDHKSDKRERRNDRKSSRKNSRDESGRKKTSRKNSDESAVGDKTPEVKNDAIVEKLEKLALEESPESSRAEKVDEVVKSEEIAD